MSNWEVRILHLGLGRFHRAHQAVYYQRMAEAGDKRWGCVSYSMRTDEARDQMVSVSNHYPVFELGFNHKKIRWIDSIRKVGSASSERSKCLKDFSDHKIEIVTLTITEKGYTKDSDAIVLIREGLYSRMVNDAGPLTIISCDNIRRNGKKLEELVSLDISEELKKWMNKNVCFPSTMVDRIVPSLTDEKLQSLEEELDKKNTQVIATEFFSQWVIEDNFSGQRPPWDKVGVEFVSDVNPYEEAKLRLLNASHSYLAYAGLLKDYQFVHEAIQDQELLNGLKQLLMIEVIPLLEVPVGFDLNEYCERILTRFTNHHLPHQLTQIAMDGSQKIPQRFISSLQVAILRNTKREELLKAVSFWFRFVFSSLQEDKIIKDPQFEKLKSLYDGDWAQWPSKIMNSKIFPIELSLELKTEITQSTISLY